MTGYYLNKILDLNAKHALYREDGTWFHHLTKFPGILFDKNGYILFLTKEEYISNPNLKGNKELHVTNGISSLKQYQGFSVHQKLLINGSISTTTNQSDEVIRIVRELDIILRKKSFVDKLKKLYNYTCQLCETRLEIKNQQYYCEVHHIVPLGKPYNGKDSLDNMLCVCPNCHVLLDFNAIPITLDSIKVLNHNISPQSIEFHNSLLV
jgi:5-methylcytosine-specific restriction protein A